MNAYYDDDIVCVILEVHGTVMNQPYISLSLTLNINHILQATPVLCLRNYVTV